MARSVEESRAGLGADQALGTVQITLFVPSVDREGRQIDQKHWVDESLSTFGRLFRGATAFPPGRGVWRDDARDGALVFDETVLVTSYVDPIIWSQDPVLAELRALVHRLGREARQGEIGLIVDRTYLGITSYDG